MASTRLSYIAVKREATTSTAVKPSHFLRYKDGDVTFKQEMIANNPIQNNRWNALNVVKGKATAEGTFNVDLDATECVHFISAALGGLASTQVGSDTTAYRHDCTLANTLPSLTLEQGKGNMTDTTNNFQNFIVDRAFGVLVNSLTLSGSDGIINMAVNLKAHGVFQKASMLADVAAGSSKTITLDSSEGLVVADSLTIYDETPQSEAKAIASMSLTLGTVTIATLSNSYTVANNAKVELQPQTPSYSTPAQIFSFTHVGFQTGADLTAAASAAEENIENWEWMYDNNLEERYGSLRSSPSVIAPKGAKATLKFTKYFTSSADRDRYLNQNKKAAILTLANNVRISATDTNVTMFKIVVSMSDIRFTSYEMPTGTDDLYAVSLEAECYYDTTDGQAVKVQVYNGKAGTEYTA